MRYINNKKTLCEFLNYEKKKYGLKSSMFPLIPITEKRILFKCNYLLRKLEYYTNCNKPIRRIIIRILYTRYSRKYFVFIPINVFDKGLKLIHIGPRLINGNCIVGKDVTLHINVCLVAGGVNDDVPCIGNNCILGVGCIILGNAQIGNNVAIGAGAVVNKDFSAGNMTIAGVPAKKISTKTAKDWSGVKEYDKC